LSNFGTAGGDLRYWVCFWLFGLAVFQFLKLVVPGAFFAVVDDGGVLQLELKGFVFVIRVFDEKIQATEDGAFHFQIIQCLVFSV
jgi:hypothetical protein